MAILQLRIAQGQCCCIVQQQHNFLTRDATAGHRHHTCLNPAIQDFDSSAQSSSSPGAEGQRRYLRPIAGPDVRLIRHLEGLVLEINPSEVIPRPAPRLEPKKGPYADGFIPLLWGLGYHRMRQ